MSIHIATRNRPDELARTLGDLAAQTYRPLELIVIDDASTESLESVVRSHWPDAIFERRETVAGQCECRNRAFAMARGKYCLQLDDDASPTKPDDIATAVRAMEQHPEVGIVAFYTYNGQVIPPDFRTPSDPKYGLSFLGAGALFRMAAVQQTGGYTPFFRGHFEEEELSIRMIKNDWAILELPDILIHHRISPINRQSSQTWKRGVRNTLWAMAVHMPLRRMSVELGWKLVLSLVDALKYARPHLYVAAIAGFLARVPSSIAERKPMSSLALRRYDALRFGKLRTLEEWRNPHSMSFSDYWRWFTKTWWNRPRSRPFWSRKSGDVGKSPMNSYAKITGTTEGGLDRMASDSNSQGAK